MRFCRDVSVRRLGGAPDEGHRRGAAGRTGRHACIHIEGRQSRAPAERTLLMENGIVRLSFSAHKRGITV